MTQGDDNGNVPKEKQREETGQAPKRLLGKHPQYAPRKYDFSDLMDASPFDVAFEYAENDWFIVPVDSRTGKTDAEGVNEATRDLDKIREWILEQGLTVGIATGRVSRIIALVCKGDLGRKTLRALQAGQGTFTTLEGSEKGTTFFLFRAPEEDLLSQVDLAPGVDFRGEGGYLVPLPSSWGTQNTELASLPDWVRSLVTGTTAFRLDGLVTAEGLTVLGLATTAFHAANAYKALGWKPIPINTEGARYNNPEDKCVPALWKDKPTLGLGLATGAASGIVGLSIFDPGLLDFWVREYNLVPLPQITGIATVLCFQAPEEGFPSQVFFNGAAEYIGEEDYLAAPPSTVKGTRLQWKVGKEPSTALSTLPKWLQEVLSGQRTPDDLLQPRQQPSQKSPKGKWSGHAASSGSAAGKSTGQTVQLEAAAQAYARDRKWLVHPLSPGSKKACSTHGLLDASRNPEKISGWWKTWRKANISLRTGAESGVVVLDVDVKDNQPGLETLAELEKVHGEKIETLMASTPSGGIHLYFRNPPQGVGNRTKFLPGLDFRGQNGYIVLAPSLVDDVAYRWVNPNTKIAEMPDWLFTIVKKAPKDKKGASATPMERVTYATALCGVQEGARNDTVFRFAYKLRQEEWEYSEALVLVKTAAGNCQPPLDEDEAIRCLESAWKYAPPAALSDLGNAKRFVALFGDRVRYVEEKEQWLVWGEHWWKTSKHGVYSKARATIRSLRDEAMAETDPVRRKLLFNHNRKSQSVQALERMLELVELELTVLAEDLDRGDLVTFSNGVFDPRTGLLRPGRREDLLTKHVPMPYDSTNPECARCLKHKGANPKVRTATIKSSKAWEERLDEWIAERCELGKGLSAGPSELLADFSSWLGEAVTAQKFGRLLSKKEGIERDKSGGRFYNGIKLKKKRKK